jgi:hypothetical protein
MLGRKVNMRKIIPIAALGLAGFFGAAACSAAVPAISLTPPPTRLVPLPSAAPTDNSGVALYIARIAVGKGGLNALSDGDGQAILVVCDPSTVSNPPRARSSTSVSCGINYSDGSVWKQTVTVIFDSHGTPAADSTNLGTEVLQPTGGW